MKHFLLTPSPSPPPYHYHYHCLFYSIARTLLTTRVKHSPYTMVRCEVATEMVICSIWKKKLKFLIIIIIVFLLFFSTTTTCCQHISCLLATLEATHWVPVQDWLVMLRHTWLLTRLVAWLLLKMLKPKRLKRQLSTNHRKNQSQHLPFQTTPSTSLQENQATGHRFEFGKLLLDSNFATLKGTTTRWLFL